MLNISIRNKNRSLVLLTMILVQAALISCGKNDDNLKALFSIDKQDYDFGEVLLEHGKTEQDFTITNKGDADLKILNIEIEGSNSSEFSTTAVAASVAVGKEYTFSIGFTPTSIGSKTANLKITHSEGIQNITLEGKAKTELSLVFNWDIQQDNISPDSKIIWEAELATIHSYFVSFFGYEDIKLTVDIIYFTNENSFTEYQSNVLKRSNPVKAGFYSSQDDKIYMINKNNTSDIAKNIFLHEGTHKIFNSEINDGAIILNEGLATVFATLHRADDKYYVQIDNRYETKIKQMNNSDMIYDLNTFFNFTHQEWQSKRDKTYAQSHSLIYFLLSEHSEQFKQLMNEYKKPINQRQNYIDFFNSNYSGGVAQLETDWKNWIPNSNKPKVKLSK